MSKPQTDEPPKPAGESAIMFICASISFGIIVPVLPHFLAELSGQSLSDATRIGGWLAFTFAVMQFLCSPLMGNLSDRFGRRPILLLSMAAFCVNYLLMGAAQSLWVLFVGRAVSGAAGAAFVPANAYVADITPPQLRAQRFGLVGAAFGVGFVLGPALGALVGQISPRAPFYVAAAMAGLNFLFGWFVLPESLPKERRRALELARANPLASLSALRKHPEVLSIVACIFLWNFAFQVYPTTWAFFATLKFNWDVGAVGLLLAFSGGLMAVMQGGFTGRIVRALGERRAAILGMTSCVAAMICNAFSVYGWQAYICATVGSLQGAANASMNAIITSRMPPTQQGELQGAVASLNGIAMIVSPVLLTQTIAYFTGPAAPFHFAGAGFLLAACIAGAAFALLVWSTRNFSRLAAAE